MVKIENETEQQEHKPRWVNVLADPVSPNLERPKDQDPMHFDQNEEDIDSFVAEIKNEINWTDPGPPARDDKSHCELKSVVIRPDPPGVDGDDEPALEFRASVSYLVNNKSHVDLSLRTNPAFVVPPRCYLTTLQAMQCMPGKSNTTR
ncbi:hypothetical protein BJX62DRAFT_233788 [Aspergillus germanicus]